MGLFGLDEDQRLGLLAAGLATLGSRAGNPWEALGRGGLLGLNAMEGSRASRAGAEQKRLQEEMLRAQIENLYSQMEERKAGAEDARKKAAADQEKAAAAAARQSRLDTASAQPPMSADFLGALRASGPTGQLVPGLNPVDRMMAAAGGDVATLDKLSEVRKRMSDVEQTGKPNWHLVDRPDGGKEWVDKNALTPGTAYPASMTPYQSGQLAAQNRAAAAEKAKADAMLTVGGGQVEREKSKLVADLRKEYNAQDAVKNYNAAAPLAKSVLTTPDTTAGDLDYIYAIGKVLDPGSVVREGEMQLVIKSGSPLERFRGDVRAIMSGKGRLTPTRRAELAAMLENRMTQLRKARDVAAFPYVLQAKRNQLPEAEIFGEQADGWSIQEVK